MWSWMVRRFAQKVLPVTYLLFHIEQPLADIRLASSETRGIAVSQSLDLLSANCALRRLSRCRLLSEEIPLWPRVGLGQRNTITGRKCTLQGYDGGLLAR